MRNVSSTLITPNCEAPSTDRSCVHTVASPPAAA